MPDPLGEEPTAEVEAPTLEHPTEELDEEASNGAHVQPDSVFDHLREQYAEATEERRITIPIAPGRFGNTLAARYKPGPWSDYRKRAERMMRRAGGEEAELDFAATTLVQCCETILFRVADSVEMIPMDQANPAWRGNPVHYDARLADAIGIDNPPSSQREICRLVFRNPAALNDHFVTLDAWLKEAIASDDDDEDDPGRPT